jgi:K+ transporter
LGRDAAGIATWIGHAVQCVLLCWLACSICSKMLGEKIYGPHVLIMAILIAAASVFTFYRGDTIAESFLSAATTANMILGLALLVGLMSQQTELDRTWRLITLAVCIHLGSHGVIAMVGTYWLGALAWLPIGAIVALAIWIFAVTREAEVPTPTIRLGLQPRAPETTLWLDESSKLEC